MHIFEKNLEEILRKYSDLEVPFFQRDYTWGKLEVQKLLDDIYKNKNEKYYLGTIILKEALNNIKIIIDGQQRLTTIWLILKAICQLLTDKLNEGTELSSSEKQILEKINDYIKFFSFYSSNYNNGKTLNNIIKDNKSFNEEEKNNYSNNFDFIKNYLSKDSANLITIYNNLFKVIFTLLSLDDSYDEHMLYSQINSTGKKLTAYDLVKNSLFSKLYNQLDSPNKEKEFDKLLNIFNNLFNNTSEDEILKRFLSYKLAKFFPNKSNEIYDEFNNLINSEYQNNVQELYDQLCRYVFIDNFLTKNYSKYNFKFNPSIEFLKEYYGSLSPLITDIFLSTLDEKDIDFINNNVNISNEKINLISRSLLLIEIYVIRRFFNGLSAKNTNRFIASQLLPWIRNNLNDDNSNYADLIFTYIYINANNFTLFSGGELPSYRIPTDEEFKDNILKAEIYKMNSQFCRNFLIRYSKIMNNEQKDFSKYTIEHVMPQDLSVWKQAGININEELHREYLHTIGNLTLTPNNSLYSNFLFSDKQKLMRESEAFVINNDFLYVNSWGIDEIKHRAEKIFTKINDNWTLNTYKFIENTTPINLKTVHNVENITNNEVKDNIVNIHNISLLRKSEINSIEKLKPALNAYLVQNKSMTYIEENFLGLVNAKGWAAKAIIDFLDIKKFKGNLNQIEFEAYFLKDKTKINQLLDAINVKK